MREIKFRAWDTVTNRFLRQPVYVSSDGVSYRDSDPNGIQMSGKRGIFPTPQLIINLFTGLHDKNGKEIYPKDLLRVKGTMGENSQYKFDCIYLVNELTHEGLSLSFVNLFNEEPDSVHNSYPISTHPSFRYGSLCVDYINRQYDKIAFSETHGENTNFRQTWKQHDYTNDIEVIGNIYETPELLNK